MVEITSFMHACNSKQINKDRIEPQKNIRQKNFIHFRVEPISAIWIASRRCKINDNAIWYWILNSMNISNIHRIKITVKTVMSVAFVSFEMGLNLFMIFKSISKCQRSIIEYYIIFEKSLDLNKCWCFQLSSQWLFVHFPYHSVRRKAKRRKFKRNFNCSIIH